MMVRKQGGLTEFIPSPEEKRKGLIHDHIIELITSLDRRIRRMEDKLGWPLQDAQDIAGLLATIQKEENKTKELHNRLRAAGFTH